MDKQAEKDKTERVTGLGRKTREEIVKWNQMTALRFQMGVSGLVDGTQTPPASLPGVCLCVLGGGGAQKHETLSLGVGGYGGGGGEKAQRHKT